MAKNNETHDTHGTFDRPRLLESEQGAIGYIAAWILGVPASVLFLIFLMRGCN